jgi:hypothetical protein
MHPAALYMLASEMIFRIAQPNPLTRFNNNSSFFKDLLDLINIHTICTIKKSRTKIKIIFHDSIFVSNTNENYSLGIYEKKIFRFSIFLPHNFNQVTDSLVIILLTTKKIISSVLFARYFHWSLLSMF